MRFFAGYPPGHGWARFSIDRRFRAGRRAKRCILLWAAFFPHATGKDGLGRADEREAFPAAVLPGMLLVIFASPQRMRVRMICPMVGSVSSSELG
jgi:hypothetical protein